MRRNGSERAWRIEFAITTAVIFGVGVLLVGLMSAFQGYRSPEAMPWAARGLMGGYLFFSMLSGIRLAVRWIGGLSLTAKVILTVFFLVPVYFVTFSVIYAVPYGIYNLVRIVQMEREAAPLQDGPPIPPVQPRDRGEDPW